MPFPEILLVELLHGVVRPTDAKGLPDTIEKPGLSRARNSSGWTGHGASRVAGILSCRDMSGNPGLASIPRDLAPEYGIYGFGPKMHTSSMNRVLGAKLILVVDKA
jgi:hypothetical protein